MLVKLPGSDFSISRSRGRAATSGCSSHSLLPLRKIGRSSVWCWTTTVGIRPAAASITFEDLLQVPGRVGDRQGAGEVFVLDVDDQQGAAHGRLLQGARFYQYRAERARSPRRRRKRLAT